MPIDRRLFLAGCVIMLAACAAEPIPPGFEPPEVVAKTSWSTQLGATHEVDRRWWTAFGDSTLDALVDRALSDNIDLQILAARIDEAGAQIGLARAAGLPVFNVGGRTDTTDISGDGALGRSTKFGTGGELAWELDVWGKLRKGVAAQRAGVDASEAEWRAGYLVLVASVADAYFEIRQLDEQIAQQHNALARAQRILAIYRNMHAQGLLAGVRANQQQAEVHGLEVALLELERARSLAENALAALLGAAPGEFAVAATLDGADVQAPAVPAGLPSDVLSRRPDVVAAEFRLIQQVHLEGQARRAQLPSIGLTGLGGSASYGLSDLLKTWTAGLSSVLQFPVFDPGVRARVRVSAAQVGVAEQQYRAVVMQALQEVESVLINLANRRQQQVELVRQRDELRYAAEQTRQQQRLGLISHLDVLEQERSLLAAEQALLANRWRLVADTVALFKAVGGGWAPDGALASR